MSTWIELVAMTCGAFTTPELADQMDAVAGVLGVENEIILAVVYQESKCDPDALGSSNDSGMMQVVPRWHQERMEQLWVTNIFDPVQNMFLGTHLLVDLGINEDMRRALATYNGGPQRPAEAYAYADEVIDIYNNLKFQREVLETRAILEEDLL